MPVEIFDDWTDEDEALVDAIWKEIYKEEGIEEEDDDDDWDWDEDEDEDT
jgi:hypothetical protein